MIIEYVESHDYDAALDAIEHELDILQAEFDCPYTLEELRKLKRLRPAERLYIERIRHLEWEANLKATSKMLEAHKRMLNIYTESFFTESGVLDSGTVTNVESNQNVDDMVGDEVKYIDNDTDFMLNNGQETILSMDSFFRRPVEIAAFNIDLTSDVSNSYRVWDIYTLEPTVRAKLRNYAYLRGDLHVQVNVSGSPFHYGRILVSYQPYDDNNESLQQLLSNAAFRPMLLNYLSQAPGAVVMDIKANKPVVVRCPFISTKPAHRLFNSSATVIGSGTSYDDLERAGSLYVYTLNSVEAVNSTASPISIQIYAWMENVALGCPTATQVAITTESGVITDKDERKTGPVERYASNALQISSALEKVPFIEPFAKASSYVFGGIKGVASIFGWSRPPISTEPVFVKNRGFANGAQTIGSETVKRITLDPMQELTVDGSVCGTQSDDMVISTIAGRESYLTTFTWSPTDDLMSGTIWKSRVTPQLDTIVRLVTHDYYQPTAMSFAATPFNWWHADIVFRFDIVASAYHRGKLAFFYEPNVAQEALIDLDIDLNKQWIKIIDIQQTQSVEFCVKWAAARGWMQVATAPDSIENYVSFSPSSNSYNFVNGYIGVVAFTDIQSPDDSSVPINVHVRAENFHVNQFTDQNFPTSRVMTESGLLEHKSDDDVTCVVLNPTASNHNWISHYHFGEEPVSFRSLMKRYACNRDQSVAAGLSTDISLNAQFKVFPTSRPQWGATTGNPDLISYLRFAYLGTKGGLRKRYHVAGNGSFNSSVSLATVQLGTVGTTSAESVSWSTTPTFTYARGTVMHVVNTNGGVEVEIPFYSSNLFHFSFSEDLAGTYDTGEFNDQWSKVCSFKIECDDPTTGSAEVMEYTAAAEDFCFMRFQGAPPFSAVPIV